MAPKATVHKLRRKPCIAFTADFLVLLHQLREHQTYDTTEAKQRTMNILVLDDICQHYNPAQDALLASFLSRRSNVHKPVPVRALFWVGPLKLPAILLWPNQDEMRWA